MTLFESRKNQHRPDFPSEPGYDYVSGLKFFLVPQCAEAEVSVYMSLASGAVVLGFLIRGIVSPRQM